MPALQHRARDVPVGGEPAECLTRYHLAADAGDLPVLVAPSAAQVGQEVLRFAAVGVFGEHIVVVAQPRVDAQVAVGITRLQDFVGERRAHLVHDSALCGVAGEQLGARPSVPLAPEAE